MAGNVQNVVNAPDDAEVAILVGARAVAGEIEFSLEVVGPIGLLVAIRIAPDRAQHRRPRPLDHQDSALPPSDRMPGFVDDLGKYPWKRQRGGSGFGRRRARQGRDHVASRLGLPPRIHNGTAASAYVLVV